MSEFDRSDQEPDFEDPTYADLRGLLSDARDTAGMPHDVLARLEATLSGMVAEREDAELDAAEAGAVVVGLRRRSRAPRLLVAAAAVVVLGGGGVAVRQLTSSDGHITSALSSKSAADSAVPTPAAPQFALPGTSAQVPTKGEYLARANAASVLTDLGKFTSVGFARQAARYVSAAENLSLRNAPEAGMGTLDSGGDSGGDSGMGSPALPAPDDQGRSPVSGGTAAGEAPAPPPTQLAAKSGKLLTNLAALRTTSACPGPKAAQGAVVVRIRFAGKPATLVLNPVIEGSQFVTAWSCDGTRLLAATTVRP